MFRKLWDWLRKKKGDPFPSWVKQEWADKWIKAGLDAEPPCGINVKEVEFPGGRLRARVYLGEADSLNILISFYLNGECAMVRAGSVSAHESRPSMDKVEWIQPAKMAVLESRYMKSLTEGSISTALDTEWDFSVRGGHEFYPTPHLIIRYGVLIRLVESTNEIEMVECYESDQDW